MTRPGPVHVTDNCSRSTRAAWKAATASPIERKEPLSFLLRPQAKWSHARDGRVSARGALISAVTGP